MKHALNEARLSHRHAEQNLHRQPCLDDGVNVSLLAAASAYLHRIPAHLGVEPELVSEPLCLSASL